MLDIAERIVAFAAGIAIVIGTVLSAVRTFVLPRSSPTILTRVIFLTMRDLFSIFEKRAGSTWRSSTSAISSRCPTTRARRSNQRVTRRVRSGHRIARPRAAARQR